MSQYQLYIESDEKMRLIGSFNCIHIDEDTNEYESSVELTKSSMKFENFSIHNGYFKIRFSSGLGIEIGAVEGFAKKICEADDSLSIVVDRRSSPDLDKYTIYWLKFRTSNGSSKSDSWTGCSKEELKGWLNAASICSHRQAIDKKDTEIVLDGRNISSEYAFYCAIGEAVNGSGGYYGKSLVSLLDCIRGGYGLIPPFKLIWKYSSISEKMLLECKELVCIEEVLSELASRGVSVEKC